MPIDDLLELVETLQRRIDAHTAALQKSEALTRYALIDPLLRGLGWDTADPAHVIPEFKSGSGSADYALLGRDGKPLVIVEAKKLDTALQGAVSQVINYCIQDGYEYFAVTNGRRWQLYETNRPGPLLDRIVMDIDLKGSAPPKTCLDALALWRPSVVEGNVQPGTAPISGSQTPPVDSGPTPNPRLPEPPISTNRVWQRLSELIPERGTKPAAIRFPDSTVVTTTRWADLSAEVVRWLKVNGAIADRELPIRLGKSTVFFVHTSPTHQSGKQFASFRQVDSWYVNANYNAGQHIRNARGVIELAHLDPADFAARLQ